MLPSWTRRLIVQCMRVDLILDNMQIVGKATFFGRSVFLGVYGKPFREILLSSDHIIATSVRPSAAIILNQESLYQRFSGSSSY